MQQDRAIFRITDILQNRQQMVKIMPVDRTDIEEAEFLEQSAAGEETAGEFLGLAGVALNEFRQMAGQGLGSFTQTDVSAPGNQPRQIGAHRTNRGRNRHVIVIEDDDLPCIDCPGIVHRLIGHSGRHCAIADH